MSTLNVSSNFASKLSLKLTNNIMRVKNPNELIQFYVENFGMTNVELSTPSLSSLSYNVLILGYIKNYDEHFNVVSNKYPSPTFLELHYNDVSSNDLSLVNSGTSNAYWKIGITLYDIDYARNILLSKQVNIGNPLQFEDIGYVCHLKDPNGFHIELLQHDFQKTFDDKIKKNDRKGLPKDDFPLGYPCCIGQITLQANDMNQTQRFYQDLLGMKLLSIQEVPKFNFTLYFFAWTNENPPIADIKDISTNREWLWKRPYTTIEIRHFHDQRRITPFKDLQANEYGFEGIRIMCNDLNIFIDKMKEDSISFLPSVGPYGKEIIIRDPDNVPIYVSESNNKE